MKRAVQLSGQSGLDAYSGKGWQEHTKNQIICGSYTGHVPNKEIRNLCTRCRVAEDMDGTVQPMIEPQRKCTHVWENVEGSCILCWARWE